MIRKATMQDVPRIAEIIVFGKRVAYRPIFNNDVVSFNELQVINVVERQAELYGGTLDTLKRDGNFVITVEDLVSNGYYVADDSEGRVVDPRNSKHDLNGLKIKLTYENGKVKAEAIEE